MKFEDFVKTNHYQVENIKYPITKLVYKDNYVVLFLEKKRIKVSLDDYVEYSLSSLKGLDEKLHDILIKNEIYLNAYQGCLRKLANKDNTVKQINTYLNRYDLDEDQLASIISRLKDKGYLNDERYASNRIAYLKDSLYSNKQIKTKLINEGVSSFYIDKYLKDIKEDKKAAELVKKYNKSIRNKSLKAKKQTIKAKLTSLGFNSDDINKAMSFEEISEEKENILLEKEYSKAKKKYEKKFSSYDLKNHIIQSLMMKGFNYDDVRQIIENDELI